MMKKTFAYNPRTNRLHIVGYCPHAKDTGDRMIYFSTEDEALANDGRAVGFCKLCQKKREAMAKLK